MNNTTKSRFAVIFGISLLVGCEKESAPKRSEQDEGETTSYDPQAETERRAKEINKQWEREVKNNKSQLQESIRKDREFKEEMDKGLRDNGLKE
jgi:hypothetical protein